jgi:hypothetical protein
MAGGFKRTVFRVLGIDQLQRQREQERAQSTSANEAPAPAGGAALWTRSEPVGAGHQPQATVPWQPVAAPKASGWIKAFRIVILIAAAVIFIAGIGNLFGSHRAAPAAAPTAAATPFPEAGATGVAERFAASYLSWDEADPAVRTAALALDVPGLSDEDRFGWDGTGKQTVTGVTAMAVTATSNTVATVTVAAKITPYGKNDKAGKAQWIGLDVPVAVRGGRVIVTGEPATVAVPEPKGSNSTRHAGAEDTDLTDSTESYAKSFFAAYGADADVSAVAAPSAKIAGLGGVYKLDEIRSWVVYKGSGDNREARVTVRWSTAGGSTVDQNYRLTLTQVRSGDTTRWQVASISGATN